MEGALRRRIPIIPVLIGNAAMPDSDQLPPSLRDIAFGNAATIDMGSEFDHQMDQLIRGIDAIYRQVADPAPWLPASRASEPPSEQTREGRSDAVGGALPIATLERRRRQSRPTITKTGFRRAPPPGGASSFPRDFADAPAPSIPPRPAESAMRGAPPPAVSSHAARERAPPSRARAARPGWALLLGATAALAAAGYLLRHELALAAGAVFKLLGLASAPPLPARENAPEGDLVDASAFAPACGRAGESVLVQVFLHVLEAAPSAAEQAHEADPSAARRGLTTLALQVKRGQRIDIVLEAPELAIDEPNQFLIWRGEARACQFVVAVPAERAGRACHIKARMLVESVPVGTLRFTLAVSASQPTAPLDMVGEAAHRYRRAFLSHSHDDRVKVLTYAQLLQATGITYFQDIASLRTMDDWEHRLHEAIDQCDLFLLFWTANAAHSEWVEQETRYALRRQAASVDEMPDIMPVFLEPDAPRPPEWLKSRHFDSLLRLAMRGAAAEAKPRSD